MVQWTKIKCVTLRSARSHPPRLLLLLLGFSHQNGAQQHTTATEKEREREREEEEERGGERRRGEKDREREREKGGEEILGVMRRREQFLQ